MNTWIKCVVFHVGQQFAQFCRMAHTMVQYDHIHIYSIYMVKIAMILLWYASKKHCISIRLCFANCGMMYACAFCKTVLKCSFCLLNLYSAIISLIEFATHQTEKKLTSILPISAVRMMDERDESNSLCTYTVYHRWLQDSLKYTNLIGQLWHLGNLVSPSWGLIGDINT